MTTRKSSKERGAEILKLIEDRAMTTAEIVQALGVEAAPVQKAMRAICDEIYVESYDPPPGRHGQHIPRYRAGNKPNAPRPQPKRPRVGGRSGIRAVRLSDELCDRIVEAATRPMSMQEIAMALGQTIQKVRPRLHKVHDDARIYVHSWRIGPCSAYQPLFMQGAEPDAAPPAKKNRGHKAYTLTRAKRIYELLQERPMTVKELQGAVFMTRRGVERYINLLLAAAYPGLQRHRIYVVGEKVVEGKQGKPALIYGTEPVE